VEGGIDTGTTVLAVLTVPALVDSGIGHSPPASVVGSRPAKCSLYATRSTLVPMEVIESILGVVSRFKDMMWLAFIVVQMSSQGKFWS
jgi:hypothetical protein